MKRTIIIAAVAFLPVLGIDVASLGKNTSRVSVSNESYSEFEKLMAESNLEINESNNGIVYKFSE